MSDLDENTVDNLTKLCRIECTDEEKRSLLIDLRKILDTIEQLQTIDTEGVEPCNHVLEEIHNVFREDLVGETLPREVLLDNAPEHRDGLICVPPIIKQNS